MYSKRLLDIFDEKWRIKGTGTGMDGQEGKLIGSVPEQFVISVPLTSWLPINHVSKRDPKTGLVTILYGDDKNAVGKIIGTLPRSYKITIGPLNKQVTKFGNVPITAKDLFFKDIRVRMQDTGVDQVQDAEVISVTGSDFKIKLRDGTIHTIKSTFTDGDGSLRGTFTDGDGSLRGTDIVSYNDGFQLLQKTDSKLSDVELEGEPSTLVTEVLTSTEGVGQEAIGEFEESGSGPIEFAEREQEPEQEMRESDEQEQGIAPEGEQEFKMSYKDLERISKMMESLSKEEQKIKDTIISIVEKAFVVNISDINIRNLLDDIATVEKHVIAELSSKGKVDIFSKNDRKFLIVAVVYQNLLRKRLIPVSTNYNVVLGDLIKTNFFKPVDTQNSSWKYLGTSKRTGSANFEKDILYLATIAKEFTETILGSLASFAEEIKLLREQPVDIFPVGSSRQDENEPELAYTQQGRKPGQSVLSYYKRQSVDYPQRGEAIKKFPTFSDIEKGIKLRPDAKMMWTPQQQNIINALKRKLTKSLETSNEMKNRRQIVQYAIGCLDNIYVEIENLKNQNQRTKELHYLQQLATILNREFEKIKVHQSMETLKKSLLEEEKRQRLLAKSEGVLPSEPESETKTLSELESESVSMDLDDITKSMESMKIRKSKARASSASDTNMDLS
jgi:hypothetical protein